MTKIDLPIQKEEKDNTSPLKPDFKWVWKMIIILISIWFILYISIVLFSNFFIKNISIEKEREIFGWFFLDWNEKIFDKSILGENLWELENYEIYISNDEIPNAYASLWANIFITKWLLKQAKSKEEILFILGHEMSHIKNRDVIKWFTKSMPLTMFLDFLGINFWDWGMDSWVLISNYFSREAERQADKWWIEFVNRLWLNWKCATVFFEELKSNTSKYTEFTKSHPIDQERIDFITKNSKHKEKKCNDFKYEEKN